MSNLFENTESMESAKTSDTLSDVFDYAQKAELPDNGSIVNQNSKQQPMCETSNDSIELQDLDSLLDSILKDAQEPELPIASPLSFSIGTLQSDLMGVHQPGAMMNANPLLALDLCKIYMDLFTEHLVAQFGMHYPMTAFYVNNGRYSTDITLTMPDPLTQQGLPSAANTIYQYYYQGIKDFVNDLADKWSIHVKFV